MPILNQLPRRTPELQDNRNAMELSGHSPICGYDDKKKSKLLGMQWQRLCRPFMDKTCRSFSSCKCNASAFQFFSVEMSSYIILLILLLRPGFIFTAYLVCLTRETTFPN